MNRVVRKNRSDRSVVTSVVSIVRRDRSVVTSVVTIVRVRVLLNERVVSLRGTVCERGAVRWAKMCNVRVTAVVACVDAAVVACVDAVMAVVVVVVVLKVVVVVGVVVVMVIMVARTLSVDVVITAI